MRRFFRNKIAISVFLFVFLAAGNVYPQQAGPVAETVAETSQAVGLNPPAGQVGVASSQVIRETLNPYTLNVPDKFGKIEEVFQGSPGSPLVVHIQDAHANYEAQLNIKRILTHLSKAYKINLIQLEGASSKLNPSVFEASYLKEANLKMADYLMREGRLSGAEAFAIESEAPVELHGIENRMLYMENLRTFRAVYTHQNEINEYFKAMRILAKDLRTKLLNEELLDLSRNMEAYALEKIDLLDYLIYLNGLAEKYKIASLKSLTEINRFPNLVRILRLHELEQRLDEKALKKEAEALKKAFQEKTSSPEVQELLSSLDLKKKGMKPRAYFRKLTSLADQHGIDLLAYPQMRTMAEFLILQDEIEHHGLFNEVHRLEKIMQKRLFKKREERQLTELLKSIDLLEQYFKLEVNREKLAYIVKRYAKMKASYIKSQLDALAKDSGVLPSDYSGSTESIDRFMDEVEYFYRVVLERDRLFVENVLGKIKSEGADRTVLITGGFHTDGLTTLLRKQNVSYLVIIPKVDVKQGNEKYVKVMMDKDSEVGSVFAGTFALQQPRLEDQGPVAFLLLAALGSGLTYQQALVKGEPIPVNEQSEILRRFNEALPSFKVVRYPELLSEIQSKRDTGAVKFNMVVAGFLNRQQPDKVFQVEYIVEVTLEGFKLTPVKTELVPAQKVGALNLVNPNSIAGNQPPRGEVLSSNIPSVLKALEGTLRVVAPQAVEATGNFGEALPFPGVITLNGAPREILSILAGFQNNLFALKRLNEALQKNKPLDLETLRQIQALTQTGIPVNLSNLQSQAGNDTGRMKLLEALFISSEQPKPRVLVVPSLVETTSWNARATQLLSVVDSLRGNSQAVAVVYGQGIEKFALDVLGVDKKTLTQDKILRRIKFVNVADDQKALVAISEGLRSGQIRNHSRKTGLTFGSMQEFLSSGIIRVLLPDDRAELSETIRANWPQVLQLQSALEKPDVRRSDEYSQAYAALQVRTLHLLPANAEETREFETLLREYGLSGVVERDANGNWKISGVVQLVASIFADYLAAREIAIRA